MKLKKVRKISLILLAAAAVCLLAAKIIDIRFFELTVALGIAAIVIAIACLIFNFKHNRCPHCREYLYRIKAEYCPHCGEKLDD